MPRLRSPKVSVLVPTYRRPDLLRLCLDSLARQSLPADQFEVIVVDDASDDETPNVLAAAEPSMPNLRWVSQPRNGGPAAARNRAAGMATGELILFVDDDIVASDTLVERHVAMRETGPPYRGVVGYVTWLPSLRVTPFMRWLERCPAQFAFATMHEGIQDDATTAFYTCNLSMRLADFTEVGGFDERFPYAAYEDTELAIRLAERGFQLDYQPTALAWHSRAITLQEFCGRMAKVAESALVFEEVRPDAKIVATSLVEHRHGWPVRTGLRFVSSVIPSIFGRDLRSAYYWSRIGDAYRQGLRKAC